MNVIIDVTNLKFYTKRTTLRPFRSYDLEDLFNYAKIDGVGEMAGWTHHKDLEESKRVLDMFINEKKTLAIVIDNHVVGSIGFEKYDEKVFHEFNSLKGLEIGFVLSKDYWGLGIFGETLKEIFDYLFKTINLDFIIAGHLKTNLQSCKAQKKIGFIKFYENDIRNFNIIKKEDWK